MCISVFIHCFPRGRGCPSGGGSVNIVVYYLVTSLYMTSCSHVIDHVLLHDRLMRNIIFVGAFS